MTLQADKPIMLITATPGGGKTALAVQIMQEAIAEDRPVFVMGIPELQLPHSTLPPVPEWTEMRPDPDNPGLDLPFFTFPENSLIVIDECQRVFRLRASASKVPDHVAAFETVRHTGVTFVLITQSPKFIDSHIRELVGQHVHLRDVGLLGRHYYEWPEAADIKTWATAPIKKKWKIPKSSFALYKSASVHIKRTYTVPPAFYVLGFAALFIALVGYYLFGSVYKKVAPMTPPPALASAATSPGIAPQSMSAVSPVVDREQMYVEFSPSVPGRPETAPAFDALRVVKQMPIVVGCIQTVTKCSCLNQQGLDAGLDGLQCRAWLANPPFDAYSEPRSIAIRAEDERRTGGAGARHASTPETTAPRLDSFPPDPQV